VATSPGRTRRWTRVEYERLIQVGVFQPGEPVELLGGGLVVAELQSYIRLIFDTLDWARRM
jgi:hypothetical protein